LKKVFYTLVIPLLLIVSLRAYSQSNKGTEFYTAFMCHNNSTGGGNGASMVLYITSDLSTKGTVEVGGVVLKSFTVAANSVTFVDIPTTAHLPTQQLYSDKSIHITSERPVAIYAHIYASNVSGATLLLPVNAMGKEYMSLNYTQISNAPIDNPAFSTFAVIGTEDNTAVLITPSANLINGEPAGTSFTVNLNKGEVYQGLSFYDLTGTKIQSVSDGTTTCKKIAVFSGASRMGIGCNTGARSFSSDNLFQQVYPTSTWGKNYVAAPLLSRPFDVYRIVLSDPNTSVSLNGSTLSRASFVNGLYYEFSSTGTNSVTADKPIQLVQYSPTQNQSISCGTTAGDVGDPEMIFLSPIEQGLNHVTLYSTSRYAITRSFINVIIAATATSSVTLDGAPYNAFTNVPGTNYAYAQIRVNAGSHTLNAAVPFNAVAYGFGNTESYGYAAGTNLQDLNTNVGLKNSQDINVPLTTGCSDKTYRLQAIIPFKTTNISWKIDGELKLTEANPVESRTLERDGKTLFVYEYPSQINFEAATHVVTATVFNPVADVCGSNQDIENVFSITDPPGKEFLVAPSNCLGDETAFKDNTATTTSNVIKSWLWDFGDGTTSPEQNPLHKYAVAGDFDVRLTVEDYSGCSTVTNVKRVHIITRPAANFKYSLPNCAGSIITFTDTSVPVEPGAAITKWEWDFGDGSPVLNVQNPTHTFTDIQSYNVKLTVTTAAGCISDTKIIPLTIGPLPTADFTLPDACVMDRNSQFASTSSIPDGTQAEFTYEWNFGDPASGPANTSTLANPQHSYSKEGDYKVTLIVKSKYGCIDIKEQTFTVNSADPHPKFRVQNLYNCSTDGLTFIDESKPDFGNVTRLRFYYDLANKPTEYLEFYKTTLRANKTYHIDYPINNTGSPITYLVKLVAYTGSGNGCLGETAPQQVVMNPSPLVRLSIGNNELTAPPTFCENDPAIQITGTPDHGLRGRFEFRGPGITPSGLFDPKTAGPGMHTITYKFIAADANTACEYNTSFQIAVSASPTVSLTSRCVVLEGDKVTLEPVAKVLGGGNLTYAWTPAGGLSQAHVINPVATLTEDATYTLTVTSEATGCATTVATLVKVLKIPVIPNAFTPNGDGINDTWEVKYLNDYPNATVEIFNRNGSRVFYSNGYTKPWNGTQNGSVLPSGTYYYIISPKSGHKSTAGYLTIIR
jgi:gliding motility-associated-like protein